MGFFFQIFSSAFARFGAALAYHDFKLMWMANISAQAAAWALVVSRGWFVFDLTRSSVSVGLVTFAAMAPQLFMPPIAGVLADRMSRRDLLAGTYAVNLAVNLALAVLAVTGVVVEWQVVALSFVNGMARATQMSTSQALAANLVPSDKLLNALSLNASSQHASRLVGPALATPLLGFFGAPAAFFLCTAMYGIGWYLMMQIRTPTRATARTRESFFTSFTKGLRYTAGQPYIRMVLAMVFFHCGLTMGFESLMPNFAHQQFSVASTAGAAGHVHDAAATVGAAGHAHDGGVSFNTEATGFSTLLMGVGLGAFFGSLIVGGIHSSIIRGRLYLAMGVFSGLGQVLMALAPNLAFAFGAAVIMGASQAAFMTMGQATMQALADDAFRGRIASLNTLALGGVMSIMNLTNGFFGAHFPAAAILLIQGLLYAGIMLLSIGLPLPRSVYVRGLPSTAPAAA